MGHIKMQSISQRKALKVCLAAAKNSEAYRTLLKEQNIELGEFNENTSWQQLPVLTKTNTFERFTLSQLSRSLPIGDLADVLTSSGRGGRSYGFRLTGRKQHEEGWFDIDLGLQDIFDVDHKSTLLLNCLPMGVMFRSRAVAVANVSVREDMACSILRDVGSTFQQTLLCTDPVFIRQLLNEAKIAGVDWSKLNTSVIIGEEMLVETQRDYISAKMGIDVGPDSARLVGSSFGVGELGLNLLFETRETIRIRRMMRIQPNLMKMVNGSTKMDSLPSIFCYNPLRTFLEILNPDENGVGELCITMLDPHAVIPLPRYATGDQGRLISSAEAAIAVQLAQCNEPWLPLVAIHGRIKDRSVSLPSVESIKELLYLDHDIADQLTGVFRLDLVNGRTRITIQAYTDEDLCLTRLQHRLLTMFSAEGLYNIDVVLMGLSVFPWRPQLDFERKFSYMA